VNYLDELANKIRSRVSPHLLPDGDTRLLFQLYALLALTKGLAVDEEDVHNAWAVWMLQEDREHSSIQPFATLSPKMQATDTPFVEAIHEVAMFIQSSADRQEPSADVQSR
jgi:hypothetical protein